MFFFWLKINLRTVAAAWQTFGFGREIFIYLVRRPLVLGLIRLMFALDKVFFPALRRVEVRNPVFIIGHPRSGTTFLHRALTQTHEFSAFEAWEIMLPSLVARRLAKRVIDRLVRQGRAALVHSDSGHEIALDQVEEDEALLVHVGNTQMAVSLSPLGFGDADFADLVYADDQPEGIRRKTMAFFRGCYERQIYATQRTQVISKLTYSGMRVRSIFAEFPDAKVVYMVRSPLETIPSHLTWARNLFDRQWGLGRVPVARLQRYWQRRYKYNVAFYRYMEDRIEKGDVPPTQFMVLPYGVLRENLAATVEKIAEFAGLKLSSELQQKLAAHGREQKTYQRQHKNLHLEEFGLTEERVREDLAFVFDKYGFDKS